ncbi:hypothetical protein [Roseomonas elaeocarpi]|uniref:HEAT repeat domain-containing protein n=1 Tax=Roseomonas elaeocarpi TaxID=907779 RepID=A0ABV6JVT9_9PROT
MPKSSVIWEPLFLAEPQRFSRILEEPSLEQRLRRWPGYEDMFLGEAIRAGVMRDEAARDSLLELYRFGLSNGLPSRTRRDAVSGLRLYARETSRLPDTIWRLFLEMDPDRQVAAEAASGWLDAEPLEPVAGALARFLADGGAASRGGAVGALLRRGPPRLPALLQDLRDSLEPQEIEDALCCCDGAMPATTRAFLAHWLDSLGEEDQLRRDLLHHALQRPDSEQRDDRHVATRFLPHSAQIIPIRQAARRGPARKPAGENRTPKSDGH